MSDVTTEDCTVVKNAEGRHSLWPAHRSIPTGWTAVGGPASKSNCLDYIGQVGAAAGGWHAPSATYVEPTALAAGPAVSALSREIPAASAFGSRELPDASAFGSVRLGVKVSGFGHAPSATVAKAEASTVAKAESKMHLGLMFFGDQENALGSEKYRLVLECAKFADREGLAGVWLPERHFTKFGCLFPSPAVLHAALARETRRIRLRAGSVVMPLHHPVRVAEDWSTVDNLSGGRVDLSFASGWHADDFALWPERYTSRKEDMIRGIEAVRKLWRGERMQLRNGIGEPVDVRIYPSPVQAEVPVWLTAASSRDTFVKAGQMGVNVLTHLFDQRIDDLAERIEAYRNARRDHGWDPDQGQVAVALHCFIAPSIDDVRQHAQAPYCDYLKSNLSLLKNLALSRGVEADLSQLAPFQLDELLGFLFEKFLGNRSLLGTPETCLDLLAELSQIGVTEAACLVDFGISTQCVLDNLPNLAALNQQLRKVSSTT